MVMEVPGERRRGRPNRKWLDNMKYARLDGEKTVTGGSARPG